MSDEEAVGLTAACWDDPARVIQIRAFARRSGIPLSPDVANPAGRFKVRVFASAGFTDGTVDAFLSEIRRLGRPGGLGTRIRCSRS